MQARRRASGIGLPSARRISARSAAPRKRLEDPPLEGGRVGGLHLDARQHVFPDAGRRQHDRRPQLAQVALHRLGLSGQLAQKPTTRLRNRVYAASPAHAIGRYASASSSGRTSSALRNASAMAMRVRVRQHDALRAAGGAGRVADDGDVLGLALLDLGFEVAGVLGRELAPELLDGLIGAKPVVLLVVEHAARIVVHDETERRELDRGVASTLSTCSWSSATITAHSA